MKYDTQTSSKFLDLQGQPVIVSFLAMEYHTLILNRSYIVIVTAKTICGAKVFGTVGSPDNGFNAYQWTDPRNFIASKTLEKYHGVDPEAPAFLTISKENFQFPTSSVTAIGFRSRKKFSMGGVPHSGSLFVRIGDNRMREFILLGEQDGALIENLMLNVCVSASRLPV
jgi:hypothetical protein